MDELRVKAQTQEEWSKGALWAAALSRRHWWMFLMGDMLSA